MRLGPPPTSTNTHRLVTDRLVIDVPATDKQGEWIDEAIYGILAKEWQARAS